MGDYCFLCNRDLDYFVKREISPLIFNIYYPENRYCSRGCKNHRAPRLNNGDFKELLANIDKNREFKEKRGFLPGPPKWRNHKNADHERTYPYNRYNPILRKEEEAILTCGRCEGQQKVSRDFYRKMKRKELNGYKFLCSNCREYFRQRRN